MSRIPLKYHTNVLFYTKYTHPTLICGGQMHARMDGRTDGWTENIYSIFRDKLLLLGEHVFLARLHVGESTTEDAQRITDLHLAYYKHNTTFMTNLKHDPKPMWLYAKNMDEDKTNMNMLIQKWKKNRVHVASLYCHFEKNGYQDPVTKNHSLYKPF
jgi:hypothetical protein